MYFLASSLEQSEIQIMLVFLLIVTVVLFPSFIVYQVYLAKQRKEEVKKREKDKRRQELLEIIDSFPKKSMTQEQYDALPTLKTELVWCYPGNIGLWFRFAPCSVTGKQIVGQFVKKGDLLAEQVGGATGSLPKYNRYQLQIVESQPVAAV